MDQTDRKPRWLRFLLALDQLGNVLILNGDEDETISSNAGKAAKGGARWACVLCKLLHLIDRNHCRDAIEADEGVRS